MCCGLKTAPPFVGIETIMYRVLTVLAGGLALAACSSSPDWMSMDALKPKPPTDTITFESSPAGAQAKIASGQTCQTPCSLSVPSGSSFNVTFSLAGYQPETEQVELVSMGDGTNRLQPNPVVVELTAAAPAPKKPAPVAKKKPAPKKPAPAAAAPAPGQSTTAAAPGGSPWPAPQQQR
jgi:hypothetical protein